MKKIYIITALLCGSVTFTSCLDDKESEAVTKIRENQNALTQAEAAHARQLAATEKAEAEANVRLTNAETAIQNATKAKEEALTALERITAQQNEIERQKQEVINQEEADNLILKEKNLEIERLQNQTLYNTSQAAIEAEMVDLYKKVENAKLAEEAANNTRIIAEQKHLLENNLNASKRYAAWSDAYGILIESKNKVLEDIYADKSLLIAARYDLINLEEQHRRTVRDDEVKLQALAHSKEVIKSLSHYTDDLEALYNELIDLEVESILAADKADDAVSTANEIKEAAEKRYKKEIFNAISGKMTGELFDKMMENELMKLLSDCGKIKGTYVTKSRLYEDEVKEITENTFYGFLPTSGTSAILPFNFVIISEDYVPAEWDIADKVNAGSVILAFEFNKDFKLIKDKREYEVMYNDKLASYNSNIIYCDTKISETMTNLSNARSITASRLADFNSDKENSTYRQDYLDALEEEVDYEEDLIYYQNERSKFLAYKELLGNVYSVITRFETNVEAIKAFLDEGNSTIADIAAPVLAARKKVVDTGLASYKAEIALENVEAFYTATTIKDLDDNEIGERPAFSELLEKYLDIEAKERETAAEIEDLKNIHDKEGLIAMYTSRIEKKEISLASYDACLESILEYLHGLLAYE